MRWSVGVVVVTAAMVAFPVALVAAQPGLATPPAPPPAAPRLPPLPASQPGAAATLDAVVAHGPFLATGFPDLPSEDAATEVAALDPRDGAAAQRAFLDAWDAMPAADPQLSEQFAAALMAGPLAMNQDPPSPADQAFEGFTGDPDNAARLANAAVALFTLGVAQMDGAAVTDQSVGKGDDVEDNAAQLLQLGYRAFSADAPQAVETLSLDLGFLTPLVGEFNSSAVDALEAWLRTHPADATARYLLGTLLGAGFTRAAVVGQVSPTPPPPLAAAMQVLAPLEHDARTAALGYSAVGDAEMREAQRAVAERPYAARQDARDALDAYDAAIRLNRDPGLLAGRAVALDFLGDEAGAVAAQQRAVAAAPRSAAGLVELAALQQKLCDSRSPCDESAVEGTARSAMGLLESAWQPRVDTSRFPRWTEPCLSEWSGEVVAATDPGDDRGYAGYSFGSLDDAVPVMRTPEGCGAGGAVFLSYTLVPTSDDTGVDARHADGAMLDTAASIAMQAAALRGTAGDADTAYRAWRADVADARLGATAGTAVWTGRRHLMASYDEAAHLVVAPAPATPDAGPQQWPESLFVADSILRHAGRFSQAARVCQASVSALAGTTYPLRCEGEDDFLAGDAAAAQRLLQPLDGRLRTPADRDWLSDDLLAADIRLHRDAAARSIVAAATDDDVSREKLGEVAMDAGDLRTAEAEFARVVQSQPQGRPPSLVAEAAFSDHGIVLLREIQPAADATPDCTTHRADCETARADFLAASAMDPRNPVFLLNLAWADRLLDFPPAVTETVLRRAVAEDPTLFPAYNDLGVLEAGQGDTDAARQDLERALAVAPQYDLATWNLGVLDMRTVGGIPAGQALLAAATSRNPVLRGESTVELRTDERVYDVALGRGALQPFDRTYGVAAAALGGVSLGALAVGTLVDLGKERGLETVLDQLGERARRFTAAVERRLGRALRGMRARPWMVTAPILVALTATVTVWTGQGSGLPSVLIAAYAALLGLLVHETGHLVAAAALRRRVRPVQSPLLLGVAVLMLPLRLLGGPCVGHEVVAREGEAAGAAPRRDLVVYWAGPAANLLVALAAGLAAVARPLPMLRVILLVQLGMVAFSFLPVEPMEGSRLGRVHRRPLAVFLLALVVVAILFSEGVL
ncbi:MAG TPA: hypothetical protein VFC09_02170 [Candidatus Dormibacteraeota bacterium]|nr:hypothetical protein [Candidatus Dormibacteraeota bacterium]